MRFVLLADHLGTIRDIANFNESTSATSVTNHRTYNSFGKLVSETNAAVDLIFGYTGKQLDDATGLQHNLFRWYRRKTQGHTMRLEESVWIW